MAEWKRTKQQTIIYKISTQKTKDWATWTPLKTRGELRYKVVTCWSGIKHKYKFNLSVIVPLWSLELTEACCCFRNITISWKESLNSDGQQLHQYQQNEQLPYTSNHWTQ
jgi:hypothetical protein